MALALIKEDETRRTEANSYPTVAEADSYFEAHLYASAWTAATAATKAPPAARTLVWTLTLSFPPQTEHFRGT